jgi:hypothetical protein
MTQPFGHRLSATAAGRLRRKLQRNSEVALVQGTVRWPELKSISDDERTAPSHHKQSEPRLWVAYVRCRMADPAHEQTLITQSRLFNFNLLASPRSTDGHGGPPAPCATLARRRVDIATKEPPALVRSRALNIRAAMDSLHDACPKSPRNAKS